MTALLLILPPILAGLTTSFIVEQWLTPKPLPLAKRPLSTLQCHIGTWLFLFAIVLLPVLRPWFAVVMLLAFQLLLVLVNHAKYDSLREPFIFQDFEYFTDAIKHPRLYLPFFGIGRTLAATIGFVGALVIGVMVEAPISVSLLVPAWLLMLAVSLLLLRQGLKNQPVISLNPAEDLRNLGQTAFFWAYQQAEKQTGINADESPFHGLPQISVANKKPPHIVVVQSESFFDPRSLSDNIKTDVLEHFDQIKTEATYYGRLQVPAWGANTVRTECAFFTGLLPGQLGIHQFNPYRSLAKKSIPNLVSHLKQSGYRTVCIHPYPSSFYLRDKVFPRLGFDQFIDITGFNGQQKEGQYIGDFAVGERITELLSMPEASEKPLFIFVITMENHGPLHLERPGPTDSEKFYQHTAEPGCDDLTVYLRHLKNADLMIKRLKEVMQAQADDQQQGRAGLLCWYGDHVPIMSGVYQKYGEPDGLTDYFIWETSRQAPSPPNSAAKERQIAVNELSSLMLCRDVARQRLS
ncbi:MAG: LTA synthase family protein [Methylovulum sp.]|nr:LTA synthase family protein [Methylovulum sp.]